jgi:hypothetical protein
VHNSLCSIDAIRAEYLDLLKKCLTRTLYPESQIPASPVPLLRHNPPGKALRALSRPLLHPIGLQLSGAYQQETRLSGLDWPVEAATMLGTARSDHLHTRVVSVLDERIPADSVEAGVWYPKVSPRGYVVVDCCYSVATCRQAVQDRRSRFGIVHPLPQIDGSGSSGRIE